MHRTTSLSERHSSIENSNAIRLTDLLSGTWNHRWSVVVLTMVLLPLLGGLVFLIPAKFDSSAQLLVRLGRGAVSIDPTANLSQTVSLQESRLSQVNSVRELLSGRELAERVVQKVGADRILAPRGLVEESLASMLDKVLPAKSEKPQGDLSGSEVDSQIKMEEACATLGSNVTISSPKEAYTIALSVRSGDPFLSRDIIQTYLEEYQKFHVESYQSVGSLDFFESQALTARERATNSQQALRDAKTQRGIVDLTAAKLALGTAISNNKISLLTTDNELAATKSEIESLISQIDALPEHIDTDVTRGIPNLAGSTMRQKLYELQVTYEDLASKLSEDHPKLVALRSQLEAASEIAKTEEGDKPQTRESVNPIRQQLELSLKSTTAKLAGTKKKRESLVSQLEVLTVDLSRLNMDEVELNQLTWEASLAESEYMRSAASRATARQINDLDTKFLSEISIVQPATLSLKKASPKRLILLVLAAALALAIAMGQAVLRGVLLKPRSSYFHQLENASSISRRDIGWEDDAISRHDDIRSLTGREELVGAGKR